MAGEKMYEGMRVRHQGEAGTIVKVAHITDGTWHRTQLATDPIPDGWTFWSVKSHGWRLVWDSPQWGPTDFFGDTLPPEYTAI